jgi:hypothetical protein
MVACWLKKYFRSKVGNIFMKEKVHRQKGDRMGKLKIMVKCMRERNVPAKHKAYQRTNCNADRYHGVNMFRVQLIRRDTFPDPKYGEPP